MFMFSLDIYAAEPWYLVTAVTLISLIALLVTETCNSKYSFTLKSLFIQRTHFLLFSFLSIIWLRNLHVFDHALVDAVIVSQMLAQTKLSFVKLLTDMTFV